MSAIHPASRRSIYDPKIMMYPDRSRSKLIFGGASYRAEIGSVIRSGEVLCCAEIAARLADPPGRASINAEVRLLEQVGLLERLPRTEKTVYLRAVETPYWEACRSLAGRGEFVGATHANGAS